jgi:hypothetical protein
MAANDAERRRLRLLWIGAGTYFLILMNGLRFVPELPYQIAILGTAFNAIVLTVFIVEIRKVYKRIGSGDAKAAAASVPTNVIDYPKRRNVRGLWISAGLYFIVMLIAAQHANRVPYQLFLVGAVLNMAIVFTFVFKLRKAYVNGGKRDGM